MVLNRKRRAAVQKLRQHAAVGHVGRGRGDRVDQLGFRVDPDMGLHAEIPLIAFFNWCISGSRAPALFFVEEGASSSALRSRAGDRF